MCSSEDLIYGLWERGACGLPCVGRAHGDAVIPRSRPWSAMQTLACFTCRTPPLRPLTLSYIVADRQNAETYSVPVFSAPCTRSFSEGHDSEH